MAAEVLKSVGHPLPAKEIAKRLIESGRATSTAQDPVFSIASTIEKTIREGLYNVPELVFVQKPGGRLIGLRDFENSAQPQDPKRSSASTVLFLTLPGELRDPVQLAIAAGLADSEQSAVLFFLRKGVEGSAADIRKGLEQQIERLKKISARL